MPVPLINFPIAAIVDGLISYLQHQFSNVEITPAEYLWDSDDRKSKIRISAPFAIDNAKPLSAPFIVLERTSFQFDDRIIDNVKSSDANTFDNTKYVSICDGYINIICGSRVASEASSLANFITMMIQADRHAIISNLQFLRNLKQVDISPEIPVMKDTEPRRWEVTVRFFASLQMGWIRSLQAPEPWTKAALYATQNVGNSTTFSDKGSITSGSSYLVDTTKDFGPYITNNPQLLEKELEKGWYYIRFLDNANEQLYTITEIIDNHTLKLQTHDINNNPVDWVASETKVNVFYNLMWNNIHLYVELPKT
jgi:hypothetical protein